MTTVTPATLVNPGWDYRGSAAPTQVTEAARRITGADMGALVASVDSGGFVLEKASGRRAMAYHWSVIPRDRWSVTSTSSTSDLRWRHLKDPLPGVRNAIVAIVTSTPPWITVGLLVARHEPARAFNCHDGRVLAEFAAHPSVRGSVGAWLTTRSN